GRQALGGRRKQGAEPVATGPIADLVMVLNADREPVAGEAARGCAVPPVAVPAVAAVEEKCPFQHLGEVFSPPIILVVAALFTRQMGMDDMVEVVAPLRVQTITATLRRHKQAHVV